MKDKEGKCELCGLECKLTLHHLIPQVKCHNKYKQMKNEDSNHIMICRQCHDNIHACYTENELRDGLSTLDSLRSDERIAKFSEWRRKHPDFDGHSKMSNRRRR